VASSVNCQKYSLEGQLGRKSPVEPTWSEKITVLSTFLEFSLIILFYNLKKSSKFSTVREKSSVKCELPV